MSIDKILHYWRPDGTREVVAAHADRHGNAPIPVEPQGGVGHQRREGGRGAQQSDQHPVRQAELPKAGRRPGCGITEPERERAAEHYPHDTKTVRQATHQHTTHTEPDQGGCIGKGGIRPRHTKFALHGRQNDGGAVHPDVSDRHRHHRGEQAQPGLG